MFQNTEDFRKLLRPLHEEADLHRLPTTRMIDFRLVACYPTDISSD